MEDSSSISVHFYLDSDTLERHKEFLMLLKKLSQEKSVHIDILEAWHILFHIDVRINDLDLKVFVEKDYKKVHIKQDAFQTTGVENVMEIISSTIEKLRK